MAIPKLGEVRISIVIINVVGAFLLGCLYEAVTRPDSGRGAGKNLQLLLGTGYCGGFTTYSSLATDTGMLFRDGLPWVALVYSLGTVVLGACATWAGIAAAAAARNSKRPKRPAQATGEHHRTDQGNA